ncbi:hypothetical protein ACFLZ7_00745 [Nanoarchaeota archaeon]
MTEILTLEEIALLAKKVERWNNTKTYDDDYCIFEGSVDQFAIQVKRYRIGVNYESAMISLHKDSRFVCSQASPTLFEIYQKAFGSWFIPIKTKTPNIIKQRNQAIERAREVLAG